jgi:hypothetical protein
MSPGDKAGKYENKNSLSRDVAARLTEITSSGITGRGPSSLCREELWVRALKLIQDSEKIAIISGFYVPSVLSPETDGPPGSLVLARALSRFGREVRVWTDGFCLDCFKKCAAVLGFPEERVVDVSVAGFRSGEADLLIYVERLGRAGDGGYYNMKGEDIREWTAPLDSYAIGGGASTIGIGDGGNEVGMGSLLPELIGLMPDYASSLCVVGADVCIPVDVSNWGAYALSSALSSLSGEWLGQSIEEERLMLRALDGCGAVDGITKKKESSVDGLPVERHVEVVSLLMAAAGQ